MVCPLLSRRCQIMYPASWCCGCLVDYSGSSKVGTISWPTWRGKVHSTQFGQGGNPQPYFVRTCSDSLHILTHPPESRVCVCQTQILRRVTVSRAIRPIRTGLLQDPDNGPQDNGMVLDLDLLWNESAFEDEREVDSLRLRRLLQAPSPKKGRCWSASLVSSTPGR